eukprot:scaffold9456_cov59-Phaeocystis_antarctica.AAC.5
MAFLLPLASSVLGLGLWQRTSEAPPHGALLEDGQGDGERLEGRDAAAQVHVEEVLLELAHLPGQHRHGVELRPSSGRASAGASLANGWRGGVVRRRARLQRRRALVGDVGELHVLVGHAAGAALVRELEHLTLIVPARRHQPQQLRAARQCAAVGAERLQCVEELEPRSARRARQLDGRREHAHAHRSTAAARLVEDHRGHLPARLPRRRALAALLVLLAGLVPAVVAHEVGAREALRSHLAAVTVAAW